MKTLTVAQPYATLAAIGAVRIVTLDTFTQYTGPIAIYAPSDFGPGGGMAFYRAVQLRPFRKALRDVAMPLGAIVATGYLAGYESTERLCERGGAERTIDGHRHHWTLTERESTLGDYSPGRFGLLLLDVTALAEPIHVAGLPGLWEWEAPAEFTCPQR